MGLSLEIAQNNLKNHKRDLVRHEVCVAILERLDGVLRDTVVFSPNYYITTTIDNREDLTTLLSLADKWTKEYNEDNIAYKAMYLGEEITIYARNAALPATCKLVEIEVDVPAEPAKPARKVKCMKLSCNEKITDV